MKRPRFRAPASGQLTQDAQQLLEALTEKQFLHPHRPLELVLDEVAARQGICTPLVCRAMGWLGLEGDVAIGRLRRTELAQLARCLYRLWRQTLPHTFTQAAPDVSSVVPALVP